jgi:hemerythrin
MAITWDESFVVGIDEIDQQHRSIVEQFEKFSAAIQEGYASELLLEMATFLASYANDHFAMEERYMVRYHYPRIAEQHQEHAVFTSDAEELLKRIVHEGASREIAADLAGKMVRWVIQHIRNHDRDMAKYVKACMDGEISFTLDPPEISPVTSEKENSKCPNSFD